MALDLETRKSFSDFPDDVQVNILSFLCLVEISAFACTCRRFAALCSPTSPSADLWLALCDRRWGSKTELRRWSATPSPRLYKTLDRWDRLIGFWRRIGCAVRGTPPLVLFEWSPSCIIGSRISPSSVAASYAVRKNPFFWLGLSAAGETLSYLHPDNSLSDSGVIPVKISFLARYHFVVEEARNSWLDPNMDDSEELLGLEAGSLPDRLMSEIYQYFSNRTSPGAEKSSRRQKKKKEKERLGRMRWQAEHFVKIPDYYPTPTRPLQGLWKGISEDMNLEFYLVKHDDVGGLDCHRVGYTAEPFAGYTPVFWTTNTTFLESPFSKEEHAIYCMREPVGFVASFHYNTVSRILCINCSYDLVLPDLAGSSGDPRNVEGRIWQYEDGTFGFGFLRDNVIVDLKRIALDGYILDNVDSSYQSYVS